MFEFSSLAWSSLFSGVTLGSEDFFDLTGPLKFQIKFEILPFPSLLVFVFVFLLALKLVLGRDLGN